jgi:PKD repeat protein
MQLKIFFLLLIFSGLQLISSCSREVPSVEIQFYPEHPVAPGYVTFSISSQLATDKYYWDFGDGASDSSSVNSITHSYTLPGTYPVNVLVYQTIHCRETIR